MTHLASRHTAQASAAKPNIRLLMGFVALAAGLSACGGGGEVDADTASAQASAERVTALAKKPGGSAPPPPPPPPVVVDPPAVPLTDITQPGAIVLASSSAAAIPKGGTVCGLSADGNLVAFETQTNGVTPDDSNGVNDVFVKDVRTGAVSRVSPNTGASCRQMTPSGDHVVMTSPANGVGTVLLRNRITGALTTVSPSATSIRNNTGFGFGSVSDDGRKVAFVTIPTTTYVAPYNYVNTVPTRILVRDVATGTLATLDTDNGRVSDGEVSGLVTQISPDGSKVLFGSSYSGLVSGDTNGQADLFVRDLVTGATQMVSTTSAGAFITSGAYDVRWLSNQIFQFVTLYGSNAGPSGDFLKHTGTGQLTQLLAAADGVRARVNPAGTHMAFQRFYSGYDNRVFVRNLATGQERLVSTSAAEVANNGNAQAGFISADGTRVMFYSNATNLVSAAQSSWQVYLKNLGIF